MQKCTKEGYRAAAPTNQNLKNTDFKTSYQTSIVKPTRCTSFSILFYFVVALYTLRAVFPSIIRSLRLYVQH